MSHTGSAPTSTLDGHAPTEYPRVGQPATATDDHRTLTASEICGIVQRLDLSEVRRHHRDVATVVAELSADAGVAWPTGHDDPTVTLLRSLARITLRAPDATSGSASTLRDRLDRDAGRVRLPAQTLGVTS